MRLIRLAAAVLGLFAVIAACRVVAQPMVEEVPFVTSPDNVTLEMLRIAEVRAGDHVIDLGSGDGRIVILAARRFGATGLGVEIDPELVRRSLASARDAGVAGQVGFRVEDLFTTDLSRATVVTLYLLPEFNLRLRPSLLALEPGTRIVSHDWDMGDWQPDRTTQVDVPQKQVGRDKLSRIHLWVVPARVQGVWCGSGAMQGATLQVLQRHQHFTATLTHADARTPDRRAFSGRIEGTTLRPETGEQAPVLRARGDLLELLPPGAGRFSRARADSC